MNSGHNSILDILKLFDDTPVESHGTDRHVFRQGMAPTTRTIRGFLLLEGIAFAVAASVHAGVWIRDYEHGRATVAESVIAAVLLAGLALTWVAPGWTRSAGVGAQAFALLGTLVGVLTIAVGVGPRTVPDVLYHVAIVAVLAWGLTVARRAPRDAARWHA